MRAITVANRALQRKRGSRMPERKTARAAAPSLILLLVALCFLAFGLVSCAGKPHTEASVESSHAATDEASSSVTCSLDSGCYKQSSIAVELAVRTDGSHAGGNIYYTLDGSVPTLESQHYQGPLQLTDRTPEPSILFTPDAVAPMEIGCVKLIDDPTLPKAHVLRAAFIADDGTSGPIMSRTFFVGQDIAARLGDVPIISIVTDPSNLFDYESGILVRGRIYDEWVQTEEAAAILDDVRLWAHIQGNFSQKGKDWERPASIDVLDQGSLKCSFPCGIRVKGGFSRVYGQRSLNVYLRESYGQDVLEYPLIPTAVDRSGQTVAQYRSFCLRNGGNDTEYLKFKDAFLQSLASGRNFSTQVSTIAIAYLNGEYMGPYNLQEKITDDFYANHYGVDPANVVVIKDDELEEGEESDFELYEQLMRYADADLSDPETWERFKAEADIDSMLDYYATEIYIGNADWTPDSNTILWRTRAASGESPFADGRWRFSLNDTESSSAQYSADCYQYDWDTFSSAVKGHPLFKSALRNEEFRSRFLQRIKDVGSTDFAPDRVQAALGDFEAEWKPFMADFYRRFSDTSWGWDASLRNIPEYFQKRYDYIVPKVEEHLQAFADESTH